MVIKTEVFYYFIQDNKGNVDWTVTNDLGRNIFLSVDKYHFDGCGDDLFQWCEENGLKFMQHHVLGTYNF